MISTLSILPFFLACKAPPKAAVGLVVDDGSFFSRPWPSDDRFREEGYPDLENWPNPAENPLVDKFLEEAKKLDGFGTNSPIYFQLDGKPDLTLLPEEIDSLDEDAAVHIIDIDPSSPYRGERFPIRWNFQEQETNWQPANFLALAPTWGFPLRPNTQYAVVLTTELVKAEQDYKEIAKNSEHSLHAKYKDLLDVWEYLDYDPEDIAVTTIFTTQTPMKDLINISKRIDQEISLPSLTQELIWIKEGNGCQIYDGQLLIPLWQYGEKPYSSAGGSFGMDENGRPIVFTWELVNFRLSVPDYEMPVEGYPVAIYSHGTGGDWTTFANNANEFEPSTQLAKAGLAGFGISQPLHADRGEGQDPELYSFNYLNPASARTMFRQGAADQIYLAKLLSSQVHTLNFEGSSIKLNPEKINYLGHSHGGEVGSLALPFMGKYLNSAVLSGAGAGLSITLMERQMGTGTGLTIQELLETAISLAPHEELSSFHPMIGFVQMLAEVTDPLNYARYWFSDAGYWTQKPVSVLMTEGLTDEYTPPKSIEIMAATAKIPIIGTAYSINPAQEILGYSAAGSAEGNSEAYDGSKITSGLVQFPYDGHFPIFQNEDAVDLYRYFFETAVEGSSVIAPSE